MAGITPSGFLLVILRIKLGSSHTKVETQIKDDLPDPYESRN